METIGICQVKAHLSEIIDKEKEICITHRGKEKAFIIPATKYRALEIRQVFQRLAEIKKIAPLGSAEEILLMKNKGQR